VNMRLNPLPNRRDDERGVVAVWLAITLIVLLGFAGWAIDFAHWNDERTNMQKAADAAALAGAVYLPDDPAGAIAAAKSLAAKNGYSSGVSITTLANANQLKVTINSTVKSDFAQVVGIKSASMSKQATSEYESPTPLDMVLVIDRTGSMITPTAAPFTDLKNAALAVLGYLNPKSESIALAVLPPSSTMSQCTGASAGAYGVRASTGGDVGGAGTTWMVAPYPATRGPVNDYQLANGTLNQGSQIVKTINCLQAAGSTDLGDPMAAAGAYLNAYGRPGARKGILFMTDGGANLPSGTQPCSYANTKASTVKSSSIQVLTIGFLSGTTKCADTSGAYLNASVTKLLANMASPTKGVAAVDNSVGCTSNVENTDGDNFFCGPKGGDIKAVFLAAVAQLANRVPRIIQ
jgi:Flp pilus assembly protein TadG